MTRVENIKKWLLEPRQQELESTKQFIEKLSRKMLADAQAISEKAKEISRSEEQIASLKRDYNEQIILMTARKAKLEQVVYDLTVENYNNITLFCNSCETIASLKNELTESEKLISPYSDGQSPLHGEPATEEKPVEVPSAKPRKKRNLTEADRERRRELMRLIREKRWNKEAS